MSAPLQFFSVPVYGFDVQVGIGTTKSKARWAVFLAGKEAGYYRSADGFTRFLADVGDVRKISTDQARAILGDHKPAGAPRGWEWPAT